MVVGYERLEQGRVLRHWKWSQERHFSSLHQIFIGFSELVLESMHVILRRPHESYNICQNKGHASQRQEWRSHPEIEDSVIQVVRLSGSKMNTRRGCNERMHHGVLYR